jgi:hypothetical protein
MNDQITIPRILDRAERELLIQEADAVLKELSSLRTANRELAEKVERLLNLANDAIGLLEQCPTKSLAMDSNLKSITRHMRKRLDAIKEAK